MIIVVIYILILLLSYIIGIIGWAIICSIEGVSTYKELTEEFIPPVPIMETSKDYEKYVIKNYIRCGAIPKKDLIVGKTYLGNCRNASEATWDGNVFVYKRNKFGVIYKEKINHFEDDNGYDLFVPIKLKE